jgi:hypothetical protein
MPFPTLRVKKAIHLDTPRSKTYPRNVWNKGKETPARLNALIPADWYLRRPNDIEKT